MHRIRLGVTLPFAGSENVARIRKASGVMKASAHAMRGPHATLAVQAGTTAAPGRGRLPSRAAADDTRELREEAVERSALRVLDGGKKKR